MSALPTGADTTTCTETFRDARTYTAAASGMTNTEWVQAMPFDVRIALAAAEDAGVGVGDDASQDPIFYEATADLLGTDSNIGSVMGLVCDAVAKHLRTYGVAVEHIHVLLDEIRMQAMSATYQQGMHVLLRWVGVASGDED